MIDDYRQSQLDAMRVFTAKGISTTLFETASAIMYLEFLESEELEQEHNDIYKELVDLREILEGVARKISRLYGGYRRE